MDIDPPENAIAGIGEALEIQGWTVPISGKLTVITRRGSTARNTRFINFRRDDLQI
ncbi:hypothetical protein [Qipengyuania nanhaisediminis]|uniref:hypothetical protein n=1 Tax=Qipengyuania nanhaisediminis TaxID=604088 RepID=UPI0015A62FD7|nr:hypothetical protein [Qipengyuania nanhaisediminis]